MENFNRNEYQKNSGKRPYYNNSARNSSPIQNKQIKHEYYDKNPKDIKIDSKKDFHKRTYEKKNAHFSDSRNHSKSFTSSFDAHAPRGVNVYNFAESRAYEIKNLHEALSSAKLQSNTSELQALPRHLRRRAASHDFRRLPSRLRERAIQLKEKEQRDKTPKGNKAKKGRKFKRRPKNLLEEFSRRSRKNKWLETHIWHAKRFKMIKKWGYTIAEHSTEKSFRACYRASSKSCLLQDKSYMEVIQLVGLQDEIISKLKRMVAKQDDKFGEELMASGKAYVEATFYRVDQYPVNPIGPVKCLWADTLEKKLSKMVFIIHPMISHEFIEQLIYLFGMQERKDAPSQTNPSQSVNCKEEKYVEPVDISEHQSTDESKVQSPATMLLSQNDETVKKDNKKASLMEKKAGKRINTLAPKTYTCEDFTLIHYQLDYVMFSLTGPLSSSILQNVFVTVRKKDDHDNLQNFTNASDNCFSTHQVSFDSFSKTDHGVLNVFVEDPRLNIPYRKNNPFVNVKKENGRYAGDGDNVSCLWDEKTRRSFKSMKISDHEINNMRSEKLLPCSNINVKNNVIPVVILQSPPLTQTPTSKYGGGFEILLPPGWSMAFWMALVYQGARVGGIREENSMRFEASRFSFPKNQPDTKAGKETNEVMKEELQNKYNRYPPDKRRNYNKLGVRNMFQIPWNDLVKDWNRNLQTILTRDMRDRENASAGVSRDSSMLRIRDEFNKLSMLQTKVKEEECEMIIQKPSTVDVATRISASSDSSTQQYSESERTDKTDKKANEDILDKLFDTSSWNPFTELLDKFTNDRESKGLQVSAMHVYTSIVNDIRNGPSSSPSSVGMTDKLSSISKDSFYILRDVAVLNQLNTFLNKKLDAKDYAYLFKVAIDYSNSLVPVKLISLKRGVMDDHAIIYFPMQTDFSNVEKYVQEKFTDEIISDPVEPMHKGLMNNFPFIFKKYDMMRYNALTMGCNTRWIIGFITSGRFSLQNGKGCGIGYISMLAYLYFVFSCCNSKLLLYRNIDSFQYRFCEIQVLNKI